MKQLIIGGLLLIMPLLAQDKVNLFGYFESQITTAQISSEWIPLASNKLRLDLSAAISDRITFGANYNGITYHGRTTWSVGDLLPGPVAEEIPAAMRPYYQIHFKDRNFLDNAFIKVSLGLADVTLGKQQLSFGSGYAWNPTDIFNTKDLFDPAYEQPGHNAIRLDWQIGDRTAVTGLVSPENNWEASTALIQMKFGLSHFDMAVMGARTTQNRSDYTQFNPATLSVLGISEMRTLFGMDINGDFLGLGIWTEYAYSHMRNSEDYYEFLAGMDYTFSSGTYCMAEFYRNILGKADDAAYSLNDWLRYLNAEQKILSRDQIYALIQHPVTDLLNLGFSGIYSFSDGSAALLPTLSWLPDSNLELLIYINWLTGRHTEVYNSHLGNGGLLRARVYF